MVSSLRVSKEGLEIVEQARKKKGWTKTAAAWCQAAFTTEATLKRFWRQVPIQQDSFIKICEAVGVNWEDVLDKTLSPGTLRVDWEEPIDVSVFYGRTKELADLENSILKNRLAVLTGIGGIGKTALVGKAWEKQIKGKFDYTIQRSLSTSPLLPELLKDIVEFLSDSEQQEGGISQLMEYLRKQRCLLILDNVETIMSTGTPAGTFRPEYQDYSKLIERLKAEQHKSCLLLISRERPPGTIDWFRGEKVGFLALCGLKKEAQELLKEQGLSGSEQELETLNTLYGGNPHSLKLISPLIQEIFNGSVKKYLGSGTIVVVLKEILEQHFSRLSDLETQIMVKLALNHEPSSLSHLVEEISPESTAELIQAVKSLIDRSLIEKSCTEGDDVTFTLQPEIRKYIVKSRLVK